MEQSVKDLEKYISDTLGISIQATPWKKTKSLPVFLTRLYAFYETSIEGKQCLLVVLKDGFEQTPGTLEKHLRKIELKTEDLCLYVFRDISPYSRKWLIAHRIHFIVPGNQMYLPELGLDLREQFRKARHQKKTQLLSPSAQAVLIYGLLHPEIPQITPAALAKNLHYSTMTMTRVLNELESVNLCKMTRVGKLRYIDFGANRHELWEKAKPLMRSPVKKRLWVLRKKEQKLSQFATIAGLDALARQSMLSGPSLPVFAIWEKNWNQFPFLQEVPIEDEADAEIELWGYDPMLFAKNGLVDSLSLLLSLREENDVRTEMALEKLMGEISWLRGIDLKNLIDDMKQVYGV